jgi:hypothetical protein
MRRRINALPLCTILQYLKPARSRAETLRLTSKLGSRLATKLGSNPSPASNLLVFELRNQRRRGARMGRLPRRRQAKSKAFVISGGGNSATTSGDAVGKWTPAASEPRSEASRLRHGRRRKLTSAQIRAARGLIRWSAEDLAKAARLGLATIRRAEQSETETSLTAAKDFSVRQALEAAGVEFIDKNGGGPGVRLRR